MVAVEVQSTSNAASVDALRQFYAKAPARNWGVSRKVSAVVLTAFLSWGVVFGAAFLFLGQ